MLDQWDARHIETVAVAAIISGLVSLGMSGYRLARQRKSQGCLRSLSLVGCCAVLAMSAAIVAGAFLVEKFSAWTTLSLSVLTAAGADVTTAAGWSKLRRALLATARTAIRELDADQQGRRQRQYTETDSDST